MRVAAFHRNRWPLSIGLGGRLPSESVAALPRIPQAFLSRVVVCLWRAEALADKAKLDRGVSRAEAREIYDRSLRWLRFWALHYPEFADSVALVEDFAKGRKAG
jgi:hypothetical protein